MQAEWVQVLGTLVTIAGLVVVAPSEAGRVLPDLWRATVSVGNRVRGWLARWLPFLRRNVTVNAGTLNATLNMHDGVFAFGRVGLSEQGTTEDQLTSLRAAVESIYGELEGLRAVIGQTSAALAARIEELGQDHARLEQAIEHHRQEQGQLNARGFPLAAMGALLAGTPWWFASWWWSPLFVLLALVAVHSLWGARGTLAAGWRWQ